MTCLQPSYYDVAMLFGFFASFSRSRSIRIREVHSTTVLKDSLASLPTNDMFEPGWLMSLVSMSSNLELITVSWALTVLVRLSCGSYRHNTVERVCEFISDFGHDDFNYFRCDCILCHTREFGRITTQDLNRRLNRIINVSHSISISLPNCSM